MENFLFVIQSDYTVVFSLIYKWEALRTSTVIVDRTRQSYWHFPDEYPVKVVKLPQRTVLLTEYSGSWAAGVTG